MSLLWGSFLFGQNLDVNKIELITFEETKCDEGSCLHYKIQINVPPKKVKIYILNRWGNIMAEFKDTEGFYQIQENNSVYHISIHAKYKKGEKLKIEKTLTFQ